MIVFDKNSTLSYDEWLNAASTEGALALIDKDMDWTSFDVVAKLRNFTRIKKVGHAGTLDPLATGLLILGFGKATKELDKFKDMPKSYLAEIKLGATTKTDDAEADEENIRPVPGFTDNEIIDEIKDFEGKIEQIPPMYSAKKVKGHKLYTLARKGQEVEIAPSTVEIFSIKILKISLPRVLIDVNCSKGTYIRSLARDIGARLGTGGYLSSLRRTAIGPYNAGEAFTVNEFVEINKSPDSQ
ncbi:MAG: tRNA pseudouridine(55) synthase TruB [Bacteroidota bacterium]